MNRLKKALAFGAVPHMSRRANAIWVAMDRGSRTWDNLIPKCPRTEMEIATACDAKSG
jgi:hypothetical protein